MDCHHPDSGAALAVLTLLPFIDKSPHRYYAKRALPLAIMFIMVLGIVLLTVLADIPTVLPDGSTLLGMLQTTAGLILPSLAYIAFIGLAYTQKENAVRAIT